MHFNKNQNQCVLLTIRCPYCEFHAKSQIVLRNHKKFTHKPQFKFEEEEKERLEREKVVVDETKGN